MYFLGLVSTVAYSGNADSASKFISNISTLRLHKITVS